MDKEINHKFTVALAGNPNVGKSTLFNRLTGMKQHTGNWPGKTVELVQGSFCSEDTKFVLTDLPGTYSLTGDTEDEQVAAEYLASDEMDCVVAVCDGSCFTRSMILVLEILKKSDRGILCINLMDEAEKKGITIDGEGLSRELNVPVVLTDAGSGKGVSSLIGQMRSVSLGPGQERMADWQDPVIQAQALADRYVHRAEDKNRNFRHRMEQLMVSRRFGVPLLGIMLIFILWLTVWGANGISSVLQWLFDGAWLFLKNNTGFMPLWLQGILIDGVFATAGRVICVMLPPMAIFFPLFTLLEDIGYLPRMAFLFDPCMARCGGCGRQALTLCMGLGCNAVGVMGCRIISSPRQRLAAILTNAFIPCNGRFPSLILLGSLLFPEAGAALVVSACVALGAVGAMAVSGILNRTVLRSDQNTFLMEMPPFRRPRLGKILVRSLVDRTLHIAGRAVRVAAPAGAVLWLLSYSGGLMALCDFLEPVGQMLGMNGIILTAFIFCLPANELLIPVILMLLSGTGGLQDAYGMSVELMLPLFTVKTAVCTMLFTLFHWPCGTTLLTVYRETRSLKKTAAAFLLPTAVGMLCCIFVNLCMG